MYNSRISFSSSTRAKSTKGRVALQSFLENVLAWLVENYAPPVEALDPEAFKVWRDTVFPSGGPDNYIDYLVETIQTSFSPRQCA